MDILASMKNLKRPYSEENFGGNDKKMVKTEIDPDDCDTFIEKIQSENSADEECPSGLHLLIIILLVIT